MRLTRVRPCQKESELRTRARYSRGRRMSMSGRKVDDRLDVVRLREHIEGADGGDAVTALCEGAQVARERGGVAGDVGDVARAERDDGPHRLGLGPAAGRVEKGGVSGVEAAGVSREPAADRRGRGAAGGG